MLKRLIIASILLMQTANVLAYEEIECSTNPEFAKNSCNQCFRWDEVVSDKAYWFFTDDWVNKSDKDMVMFKVEQTMPVFLSINGTKIEMEPKDANFWEYTADFDALYNKDLDWNILKAWEKVTWLKSSDWAWVKFSEIPNKWQEAWMLVYDILAYPIVEGLPDIQVKDSHKECVLFTSGQEVVWTPIKEIVVTPTVEEPGIEEPEVEKPKFEENPEVTKVQSGPGEMALFIILTLLLSTLVLNRKLVLEKIRK